MRDIEAIRAQVLMDLLIYKSNWMVVVGVGIAFPMLLAASTRDLSIAAPMMIAVGMGLTSSAFSQDQAGRLDRLYGALPITRRQFINSRYLLQLGWSGVQLTALFLAVAITRPTEGEMWSIPVLFVSLSLLVSAVLTPLIIRFGSQHTMLILAGIMGVGAMIGILLSQLDALAAFTLPDRLSTLRAVTGGTLVTGLVGTEISRRISQRLYAVKDL